MAADANIFAQYLKPVKSVQDYSNDMDTAEQNKLTLAASRMKAQQDQQAMSDDNALRSAYQQSGGDPTKYRNALIGLGNAKAVQALDATELKARGDRATAGKSEAEIIDKSLSTLKTFASQMVDKAGGVSYVNGLYADPVAGPLVKRMKPLEQALAEIPDDPAEFLRWKSGHMNITADKLILLLTPKTDGTMLGANQSFGATDQFTGKRVETGSAPILESANNVANNERMVSEGKLNRGVQVRGQDLIDSRARDKATLDAGTAVSEAGGPSQAAFTKQFGKAEPGLRWKADGTNEPIPGGTKDMKAQGAVAGKDAVNNAVATLRNSYDALDKGGGITSTDEGTLSNIGRSISKSPIGQFAGGAVGGKNQKERDAIAQARPMLLQAMMKATGMSAKQMDSNAELKLWLSTATDPTLSLQANREALDRIETLFGNGFVKPNTGGASGDFGNPGKTKSGATVSNW